MMAGVFDEAQLVEKISPTNANVSGTILIIFLIFLHSWGWSRPDRSIYGYFENLIKWVYGQTVNTRYRDQSHRNYQTGYKY